MTPEQIIELKTLEAQAFDTYKRLLKLRNDTTEDGKVSPLDYKVRNAFESYCNIRDEYFYWL